MRCRNRVSGSIPQLWRRNGEWATPCSMSRPIAATLTGLFFIFFYIAAAVTLPDVLGRMHWAVEAAYWGVAGIVWVLPIRWLMLWSVHKR